MSWSVSVPPTPAAEFLAAVEVAELPADTYNKPELVDQWRIQLEAAKLAVIAIVNAQPFGAGGTFSVGMTGHANHDGAGEGTDYTPSEFVYVNVQRQPTPVVVAAEETSA